MSDVHRTQAKAVKRQIAARKAVKSSLERHKLVIAHKRHSSDGMSARVLFDGEYYDVNARSLAMLQAGKTPGELGLEPYAGDGE
ncbi:MAG: hypothetical protein ABWZ83_02880 [Mesorhizobium sp.]|jgi:hypothetical protein